MTNRFTRTQLRELANIKGGKRLPKGKEFNAEKTDHPYIRARDIKDGRIVLDDPIYLTSEIATQLSRYTVSERDVCITIVGANVGDVGAVPRFLSGANLTENAVKVVANERTDQVFLKYALLTDDAQDQMKVLAGGAAQPKLGIYKVETVEIPFPPHATQRKIASILSAYDDLIENNTRRIAIMEEMAQRIYREWFVHFRYPGHKNDEMVENELGMIPEGWGVKTLEEISKRITDGSHWSPKSMDDGYPMASVKDMHNWGFNMEKCRKIPEEDFHKCVKNDCKPLKNDVLIAKDGSYLKHIFVTNEEIDLVILSSIAIIRPNELVKPHLLALYLKQPNVKSMMAGFVSGAALPRIILKDFRKFLMPLPPMELQERLNELIEPMIDGCFNLIEKNKNLCQTRDLLLPKLISGKIDVSELNINTGDQAT